MSMFLIHEHEKQEREREAALARCPTCDQCEEKIQEDYYFETEDGKFCPECWDMYVRDNFLKYVE